MAEIIVLDTCRQYEVIIGKAAALPQQDLSARGIHADRLVESNRHVTCVAKDRARWLCDFVGRERRSGYLVQQWLKKVVIAPIDQDDVNRGMAQVLDQGQASEPASHYDHARLQGGWAGGLGRWSHLRSCIQYANYITGVGADLTGILDRASILHDA